MASTFNIKSTNPQFLVLILLTGSIIFFIFSIYSVINLTNYENQVLVEQELNLILRGAGENLKSNSFRLFVDKIALSDNEFYIELEKTIPSNLSSAATSNIQNAIPKFEFGLSEIKQSGQCSQNTFYEYSITFCRPKPIPWNHLFIIGIIFTIYVIIIFLGLFKLKFDMTNSFKDLFTAAHIPFPNNLSFKKAWHIASQMASQFENYKNLSIELEKQRVLNEMATQVAHDIRAPLTAIESALSNSSEFSEQHFNLIKKASHRLKMIAEDLLLKPDVKSLPVESEISVNNSDKIITNSVANATHVVDSINEIVEELNSTLTNYKIKFDHQNETALIAIEKNQFIRMLSNLLQNSIDSQKINQSTDFKHQVSVSIKQTSDKITINIQDNGKGIPEEILSQIGNRRFSYGKVNGNGLGVSHAKAIIHASHGEFNIYSKIEIGTLVSISLPLTQTTPQ